MERGYRESSMKREVIHVSINQDRMFQCLSYVLL